MKNNKLLIVADSMAMPRSGVFYEDTWVYSIKKKFVDIDVIEKVKRASTSRRLREEGGDGILEPKGADLLEFYTPDYVLMQLGVADCAPRLFNSDRLFTKVLHQIPSKITNLFINYIKVKRGRKAIYAYVNIEEFKNNIINYLDRAQKLKVKSIFAIEIGEVSSEINEKSPEFRKQIESYNRVLHELSDLYDFFIVIPTGLTTENITNYSIDGYHLNANGQKFLSKVIIDSISSYILGIV